MKNRKLSGIHVYVISLLIIVSFLMIPVWFYSRPLFWVGAGVVVVFSFLFFFYLRSAYRKTGDLIRNVVSHLDNNSRDFLLRFPMPVLVVSENREILWYSDPFAAMLPEGKELYGLSLDEITKADFTDMETAKGAFAELYGRQFRVTAIYTDLEGKLYYTLYFFEITELYADAKEYKLTRPSVMILMVDNYTELTQQAKESEKTRISGEIEGLLEDFAANYTNGFVKRFDSDKFLMVVEEQHLEKIIEGRFSILDQARGIQTSENIPITFSIGVGHGEETLAKSEQAARQALDMALGRGGDQAAVKNKENFEFFGGVSKGVEKRSKVRTRIIANSLSERIAEADKVFVMGHKFADLDAVGAAAGMAYAIRQAKKDAFVVLDREKNLAKSLYDYLAEGGLEDLFIDPDEALFSLTPETLVVICDTHVPYLVESERLYEKAKKIVVIDHHRKMVNHIDNADIFYHEPIASSASELVAELVQYLGEEYRLNGKAATALLAGITLDTKNFALKTGVRTFEAAAYLKRAGADTIAVKRLFSSSMDSYQKKSRIVASAQIYKNCAIAESDFSTEDIRVTAPQAADELLGIEGVKASFVLFETGNILNISARSLGEVNVQIIMEMLSGGGHQTMAATQLKGVDPHKGRTMLLEAIDRYEQQQTVQK